MALPNIPSFNVNPAIAAELAHIHFSPVVTHDNDIIDPNLDGNGTVVDTSANDLIATLGGNDTITVTAGNDEVHAGDGNDTIFDRGTGIDELFGEGGNDTFVLANSAGGNIIDGGDGTDTVAFDLFGGARHPLFGHGVDVDLAAGKVFYNADGTGPSDSITNVENARGTDFADKLTGDGHDNLLQGNGGDDTLSGGAGRDTLDGGSGNDTASFADATAKVVAHLGDNGSDGAAETGNNPNDTDVLRNIENLTGGSAGDALTGNSGANVIDGGAGNDSIHAGAGDDTLLGGSGSDVLAGDAGNDVLKGGAGNDTLIGGVGADTLEGGAGSDTFRFLSKDDSTPQTGHFDTIKDFDIHNDVLDLSGIDADESRSGNQAFQIVDQQFAGTAGTAFLSYSVDAAGHEHTFFNGFTNGNDSVPDFVLEFDGHVDLTTATHVTL